MSKTACHSEGGCIRDFEDDTCGDQGHCTIFSAIQAAKLEAYQEAAKMAETLANDGLTDSRNPVYLLLDLARDIRKLGNSG